MSNEESRAVQMVIAKAWSDPAFKSKLLSDASAALAGIGIATPKGVKYRVHEDTPTERHFVLPPPPTGELSDELLESATGGLSSQVKRGIK
jgi:hypothetical protein